MDNAVRLRHAALPRADPRALRRRRPHRCHRGEPQAPGRRRHRQRLPAGLRLPEGAGARRSRRPRARHRAQRCGGGGQSAGLPLGAGRRRRTRRPPGPGSRARAAAEAPGRPGRGSGGPAGRLPGRGTGAALHRDPRPCPSRGGRLRRRHPAPRRRGAPATTSCSPTRTSTRWRALHGDPDFHAWLSEQMEGDYRVEVDLAPPLFARIDPETGPPAQAQLRSVDVPGHASPGPLQVPARHTRSTPLDTRPSAAWSAP